MPKSSVRVALIKPSRYDDEGYVVQWRRSLIPSNTLAVLHALMSDCAERRVLGPDVPIEILPYDETNTVLPLKRIARWVSGGGPGSFVGLVGVQSNQFPRAMDIARPLREVGLSVVVGGFHVSGCLAMLAELPPDIAEARDLGVILYAGECEGRLEELLKDLQSGTAKPVYDHVKDLPDIQDQPVPVLPREKVRRTVGWYASFDAGRGCPFQCSFCTIINVQGRKSRYRSAEDIERIVRANLACGTNRFFITDDNFARNRNWEAIFDRLIALRRDEGLRTILTMQVDTLCHKIPSFIDKAREAGVRTVYIGLENINPDNLAEAKKRQNRIGEYRQMVRAWKDAGVITYAGYILGFPGDTPERIDRDIAIIMEELPVDFLQFYPLTPLPGSEDHRRLLDQGVAMDPDMNRYDLEHVVVDHPRMSREEWTKTYWQSWDKYYSRDHMERIMRRRVATGKKAVRVLAIMAFKGFPTIEKVHPIQGGWIRRKVRSQRRRGLPLEAPLSFYPRRAREVASTTYHWVKLYLDLRYMAWKIARDPDRHSYSDRSLADAGAEGQEMTEINGRERDAARSGPRAAA